MVDLPNGDFAELIPSSLRRIGTALVKSSRFAVAEFQDDLCYGLCSKLTGPPPLLSRPTTVKPILPGARQSQDVGKGLEYYVEPEQHPEPHWKPSPEWVQRQKWN